jgi:hypothetical protein
MLEVLQAHGLDAGPTQRPLLAGAVSAVIASGPALLVLLAFGSTEPLGSPTFALIGYGLMNIHAGVIYAWLFQRAANDARGGWLFGISFGFIVWMLIPVPLLQWLPEHPALIGYPAVGLFLAELLWGLFLGFVFPFVSRRFRIDIRTIQIGPEAAARPKR